MFDLESGIFDKDTVGSDSLKDLAPDPTGTGRRVRINSKGQVVEIIDESLEIAPRIFRGIFTKGSGFMDTEAGIQEITGDVKRSGSSPPYYYTEYRWVVPAKVTRFDLQLVGGGMGYREDVSQPGTDAKFYRHTRRAEPGETFILRVGHGTPSQSNSLLHTVAPSSLRNLDGSVVSISSGVRVDVANVTMLAEKCPYRTYGRGGQVSGSVGQDGLIIIEYYA